MIYIYIYIYIFDVWLHYVFFGLGDGFVSFYL